MSFIAPLQRESVTDPQVTSGLDGVRKQLGRIPNLFGVFAHTPVALNAYLQLSAGVSAGRLPAGLREQIALAVAEVNGCEYCDAAHTAIGRMVGLSQAQIDAAREARADKPFDAAVLQLARQIVEHRGSVPLEALERARSAGIDDATVLEVLVVVVLNILTNYTNNLARTEVDFPQPQARAA